MSVSDNSKYTFPTLPIKKRPVTLVQSSSPPLQDRERPESKPFITGLHSSASTRGIQASGATIKGYCLQHKIEPKEEFIVNSDLDKVTRCTSFLGSDRGGVFGLLLVAKSTSEDSTLKRKPVFQPLMESAKVLSPSNCSTRLQKGVSHNDKPAQEKIPVSAALQFSSKSVLVLSSPGQNTEAADPESDYETEEFQALCRMNLDLNLQMEAWDDSSDSITKKQGDGGWIETGGLQLPSSEITRASIGRDATLGKYTLQKSTYNFGLGDLSSAPNGRNDLGVSIDLQLKPPSKPLPPFNWSDVVLDRKESDAEGIDLSLSMVGSRMKPEPCDVEIQGNKVEFDLQNSTSVIHVKSEPSQEDGTAKTTAIHNSVSDSHVSTKRAPPGDPKSGGEDSPASMSSDRMIKSVMGMTQDSCVRNFYKKFDNSRGHKFRDFYNNKFEIDLNSLPVDSDDDSSMPSEANEISAQFAGELASHDHSTDSSEAGGHGKLAESSSSLKDENGIVAKSSTLVPEPMEIEQKELNSAKDVSGADGLEPGVSQRSKPAVPDTLHDGDSKMVSIDCNDPIASEVISAEVHMEVNGKSEAADSDEESEEFEGVLEEVSGEESEEIEEVEVSCDNESEEYEEIIEVSCDNEIDDSSHHVEGAGNTKPKADSPHDEHGAGEVRCAREESALHGKYTANSVPATSPAIMASQEDVMGSQNPDAGIKRELELNVPEIPQPSALGAPPATTKKRPLNATDLGLNKDIVEATEDGNMKPGRGTWKKKSGRRKDTAKATEEGKMGKGWGEPGEKFAEATNVGSSTKNGWESWGSKSGLNKDTAEATKVTKNGWEPWATKSGINKDTAEPSENGCYASRQGNARRMHNDASKCEGSREPSRVTNFNTVPERSSCGKRKPHHPISSLSQRDGFSGKPFRHDKPQPRWHRDDRRNNQKICRFDNNRNQANQFGMRRSDYTWRRQSHDALKFPRTENARECVGSPSSRRPVRDANQTVRSVSPSGSYIGRDIGRDISDLQSPQAAHEGRVITRDLPGSCVNYPGFSCQSPTPQYVQAEDVQGKRSGSPSFMPSPTPLEHPPEPQLRSPLVSEHNELLSSHQHAYYPQNTIVPRHASKADDDFREMNHSTLQYSMSGTSLQRNTNQRRLDSDPQQAQEERFRCVEYNHGGQQTAGVGSFGERHYGAGNGPRPRPTPYASVVYKNLNERDGNFRGQLRNIKQKMWDIDRQQAQEESFRHERYDHDGEQRVHAGSSDQRRTNGLPKGPRDAAYGSIHERLNSVPNESRPAPVHEHCGERGISNGNVFDRLGETPNGKQTGDAELWYERNFGAESGPRPAPYGERAHKHFQQRRNQRESGGNFRKQFGGNNSNGARGVQEQAENCSFHGGRRWRDTKFSDAGVKRRKY